MARGDQVGRVDGFRWIKILEPGGERGVVLKLKEPKRWWWADRCGCRVEGRRRFRVRIACGRSLGQWVRGKWG